MRSRRPPHIRRQLATASLSLAIASIAVASLSSTAVGGDVEDGWIDSAIRFRASVDLPVGRAFVQSTFSDPEFSSEDFGVPLSAAEVAIIRDRQARTASAKDAHEWAWSQPNFAGAWTDQERDGTLVYQFTGDVQDERQAISSRLPAEVLFEVRRVDRSLADLRDLKRSIASEVTALDEIGVPVTAIGLNVRGNAVRVGVASNTEASRTIILEQFGQGVQVKQVDRGQADCSGLRDCSPLKGGIRVFDTGGDADCTAGFLAKKPNGRLVVVTAGHCIRIAGTNSDWKHKSSGNVLGVGAHGDSVWCCDDINLPGADIGFFVIDTEDEPADEDNVIVSHANSTVDDIRNYLGDNAAQHQQGEIVCRMGHGSIDQNNGYAGYTPKKCGEVGDVEVEIESCVPGVDCRWVDNLREFEGDSTGGDSGGTVFVDYPSDGSQIYLLGTHVHSVGDNPGADGSSYYEPVGQGLYEISNRYGIALSPCVILDPC